MHPAYVHVCVVTFLRPQRLLPRLGFTVPADCSPGWKEAVGGGAGGGAECKGCGG